MAQKRSKKKRTSSGAVGGPATGAGLNYQVDFAIFQVLDRISRALVDPLEDGEIAIEPRVIDSTGMTCWDVRVGPPELVTEAKLKPRREEILEWLGRVEIGTREGRDRRFQLFYGRGAPQGQRVLLGNSGKVGGLAP